MNREAIYHRTYSEYCFALTKNHLVLRLRAKKGDLSECVVFYGDRMELAAKIHTTRIVMDKKYTDALFDYYEADLYPDITRLCYYFQLFDGAESIYYYNDGFFDNPDDNRQFYFQLHYIREENMAVVPEWAKQAVIYQIYPDSFATGENYISCNGSEIAQQDGLVSRSKFGGTLDGITANIGYLNQLGISCIYLTPIFRANSWHKYDTIDYLEIDPCLGSKDDFKKLVDACHCNGIRVMLDAVFNHCSPDFFAFRDVLKNGKNSKYKDWFYIKEFPIEKEPLPNYECFAYVNTMPKLNTGNPEVKQYLLNVAKYWTQEFHIDAWRLDVANEIDFDFWRDFRRSIKTIDPENFIVGEIWDDARMFLQGDQMDSLMNYNLYFACIDFFAKGILTAKQFDERINYLLIRYKRNIQYAQMNLIDSHDVPRFLSYAEGDVRKLKLAALFLLTHVGVPCIFYGDEKGLSGWNEIEFRKAMHWDNSENELFQYYQRLITLRHEKIEIMLGDYISIYADDNLYVYARQSETNRMMIIINNSNTIRETEIKVTLKDGKITDPINECTYIIQNGSIHLSLKEFGSAVII